MLFVNELSERLKGTGVTANCVDPGYVYTDLMRHSSVYKSPYSPVGFVFKMFLKTPKMGAQPVIFACVSEELENISGKYLRLHTFYRILLFDVYFMNFICFFDRNFKIDFQIDAASKDIVNRQSAARLWAISEKWTRLTQ